MAAMIGGGGAAKGQECAPKPVLRAKIAAVLDAQTLQLDSGEQVRLVGAFPPEVPAWWKDNKPWPASAASHAALRSIAVDRTVELRAAEGETPRDRHGRFLAQVYVVDGPQAVWVQGEMIASGFSRAYSLSGHAACARPLQQREDKARRVPAGLWEKKNFIVFSAASMDALLKRRNTYQIVEGRVHSVGHTRKWSFVNFTKDWKTDFTIVVTAGNRRQFDGTDLSLDSLKGKQVRVRGWIERWNGPAIKVTHPEQLEIIQ